MKKLVFILLLITLASVAKAETYNLDFGCKELKQSIDSLKSDSPSRFKPSQLITSIIPIAVGSLPLYVDRANELDISWSSSIYNGNTPLKFDDYLQYSPIAIMWGLDLLPNIEPRHKFKQQTTILLLSTAASLLIVRGTKMIVDRARPDTGATNSFPSGHTATAFMGAELLHQEYGDQSVWISIAGYSLAAATGYMRVYNQRHYVGDVIAGAGVGILSAKIAYWLAPSINRWLWGSETGYDNKIYTTSISPCPIGDSLGIGLSVTF
ncbi:MAG: phosphatase PAP2 family protein [Rikenellaceae bacterium]